MVGFLALIGNEIGGLFVDSKYHGEGIGRALMDHAKSLHEKLELNVFRENMIGRQFYEKCGFKLLYEHLHDETGFMQLRLQLKNLGEE